MTGELLPPVPSSIPTWARRVFTRARQRACKGRLDFALKLEDMIVLWEQCEGRCGVSGLDFSFERFDQALVKHPFGPSIDRIDPKKGYTIANTRLVCTAANFAMNQWGSEVLRRLAYGMVKKERDETDRWYRRQRRRLRQYERAEENMAGEELAKHRQRIAGLKRALTLGPVQLSTAAARAVRTKRIGKDAR